jgi:hypothetical protein
MNIGAKDFNCISMDRRSAPERIDDVATCACCWIGALIGAAVAK